MSADIKKEACRAEYKEMQLLLFKIHIIDRQLVPERRKRHGDICLSAMGKRETGVIPVRSRHCDKGVRMPRFYKKAAHGGH